MRSSGLSSPNEYGSAGGASRKGRRSTRHQRGNTCPTSILVPLVVGVLVWVSALVWSPYVVTHHAPHQVSFVAATAMYVVSGVICHQRPTRSFRAWRTQLPVCARCTGLYAGAALGLLATLMLGMRRRTEHRRLHHARLALVLAAVPTALAIGGEALGFVQPSNLVRAAIAVPLGFAVACLVSFLRSSFPGSRSAAPSWHGAPRAPWGMCDCGATSSGGSSRAGTDSARQSMRDC